MFGRGLAENEIFTKLLLGSQSSGGDMKRIGTVIVIASLFVIAKFGGLIHFSWVELRILGELAMIWLIYDLVRSPVTQFIQMPLPSPHLRKMVTVKHGHLSGRPMRWHLKSGEMREGFVVAYSYSLGTFTVTDQREPDCRSPHRFYDINEVDELIVIPYNGQELPLETPIAEQAT